jgi:rhodanese-related sulfurtransferase
MILFSCHLTRSAHSGGNPEPGQNDGLKQHPDPDENQKHNEFIHNLLLSYIFSKRFVHPFFYFESCRSPPHIDPILLFLLQDSASRPEFRYFSALTTPVWIEYATLMQIKSIIKEVSMIMALALAAGFFVNSLSPRGINLIGASGRLLAGTPKSRDQDSVFENPETARAILQKKEALFVDARPAEAFRDGHIPGALSFPVQGFDEKIVSFWEKVPADSPIVVYCSGQRCEDSHRLAEMLTDAGYRNIRVFSGGYAGWVNAGFPISVGEMPSKPEGIK